MDTKPPNNLPTEPSSTLVGALRRILQPLVKLLIANQVTYPYLVNLLKDIYVDVADREFPVQGKKQTDSRINLLTGVHRKDVKRIRADRRGQRSEVPANISIGAQLVARWMGDSQFHDSEGKPRSLPLRAQQAASEPAFEDLVEDIARQDIRPRVVLDELIRLGIVSLEGDSRVSLKTEAFTPEQGLEEKLFFFGKNLQDHICAGTHNLSGKKPAFFDRSVYYDELSHESIDTLTQLCNRIGMETLISVNEKALQLQTRDKKRTGTRYRMNFGIFNFNTEFTEPSDDEGKPGAREDNDE